VSALFAQRVRALASAAARVHGVEDREATHDLWVSARLLDAMLWTWSGLIDAGARARATRALRRLRRRLGKARELESHVALLERTAAIHGEPVTGLLERMRRRLSRRTERAAKRLRPERLRRLLERVETAASSVASRPIQSSQGFARARAHVSEVRAVALAAVECALAREDDWLLRRARIAVKNWRYAVDCVDANANGRELDPRSALRQVQEALGTIQDRAALIAAVERFGRKRARPGLQALLEELKAEKHAAFRDFRALAGGLGVHSPAPTVVSVFRPALERAAVGAAPVSTDERWERMAQWLLEMSSER
jgi:CHAD domain-containing protein